jgi:hypothetical protein
MLLDVLFGAGWIGLRSLATGLPIALLSNPRRALAEGACDKGKAQYIILSTSSRGDPLNANVPGTFEDPGIAHSPLATMARTALTLRGQSYTAARPWSTLPQSVLDQTVFFHHATQTNVHGNQSKVMELMGAVRRREMLVSLLAARLAPCLGTVQREPVVLGATGPQEYLKFQGRVLPALNPLGLKELLVSPQSPISEARLRAMRDQDLDALNALYKQDGTAGQRAFLDSYALSQRELRGIADDLLTSLSAIANNQVDGQITAAVTLIKMNVAPVVSISIPFGGDNHGDTNLATEANQTVAGVNSIRTLLTRLQGLGLADRVTFVAMNVFGRTLALARKGVNGRDHLANHHCTVMIGKGLKGGVIGGVEPRAGDYAAQAIDSRTGRGGAGGDIPLEQTLGAMGKTLGAAVGLPEDVLNENITTGKIIGAALA